MSQLTRIGGHFPAAFSVVVCCRCIHARSCQATAPAKPAVGTLMSPSLTYGKLLSGMEQEFVSAAEAMPEDKYNFAPPAAAGEFKGVRTFGEQVKHVAEANAYFFHDPSKPWSTLVPTSKSSKPRLRL